MVFKKIFSLKLPKLNLISNGEVNLDYFSVFISINKKFFKSLAVFSLTLSIIFSLFTDSRYGSGFQILNSPDNELNFASGSTSLLSQFTGSNNFQYSSIISSKSFLRKIVNSNIEVDNKKLSIINLFSISTSYNPINLYQKLTLSEEDYVKFLETKTMNMLLSASNFSDQDNGIFTFNINLKNSEASFRVANLIMDELNAFSINNIQTSAFQKRQYLERRLLDVDKDIQFSELALQNFLNDNKNFRDSPRLMIDYNRLQISVDMNYQIKSQLIIQIELLKASELKDNLQFIVIDSPSKSLFRSNTISSLLIEYFVMLFITIFIVNIITLNVFKKNTI